MEPLHSPAVAEIAVRSLRFGLRPAFAELQQNVAQQPRGTSALLCEDWFLRGFVTEIY